MVDYNQGSTLPRRASADTRSTQEAIYWLEEPIRHDDYAGCAALGTRSRRQSRSARIFPKVAAMAVALAADAADYVMPDLERIGGVTGWQRAAALPQSIASRCHRISIQK